MMEILEIFHVLGIEATKDERAIRDAYRAKLAMTNPEENPEGFKRLRTAYEGACSYAKLPDEEPALERDDSPSGLWVEKAAAIYRNIADRRNVEKWRELFAEDIFFSLEEEENCRMKLLIFLMDHFKLPTDVWKLLDEKLNISLDAAALREYFPGDFIHYLLIKCERGEDVEFAQFEGEPEAAYDLFLQYYDHCWNALQEKQIEQAKEYIQNADALQIFHPVMEVCRAYAEAEQGEADAAMERMLQLRERFPADAMICYNTAELMWRYGRKDWAAEIYRALKAQNDAHYMANARLTEWEYEQGRYEEAKKYAENVLACGAEDGFMELLAKVNGELEKDLEEHYRQEGDVRSALELGWCYLQDGKISRGIRLVEAQEARILEADEAEYQGLLTKLYMEETEYEKALERAQLWEQALQRKLALQTKPDSEEERDKIQNRIRQYHLIRMQCFHAFGDMTNAMTAKKSREYYKKAIAEGNLLLDKTSQDIMVFMEQAQIYMEMGEYEQCLALCDRLLDEHQAYAAYALQIEAHRRQWNAPGVVQAGLQCISCFPEYARAYEHMAKVFLDLENMAELERLLEDAKERNIESVILDAFRFQMTEKPPKLEGLDKRLEQFRAKYAKRVRNGDMDAYAEGLPILTKYLYYYPCTYLLVERGWFHHMAHRYQEARKDFEKALEDNPRHSYALNGMAFVYQARGDYEQALVCLKQSERYRDPCMSDEIYEEMAKLHSRLGNHKEALAAYEQFAKAVGRNSYDASRLAAYMVQCGEADRAVKLLASAYGKSDPNYWRGAVDAYQLAVERQKAEEVLKKWGRQIKTLSFGGQSEYYGRMAWQELLFGDGQKALQYMAQKAECMKMAGSWDDGLRDIVFACILCGDDEMGKKYAARLKRCLDRQKKRKRSRIHWDKCAVYGDILAGYYTHAAEELEVMLDEDVGKHAHADQDAYAGEGSVRAACSGGELEGIRILLLLKAGKEKEALARLNAHAERQKDIYMLAIRHICESREKRPLP